VGHQLRDLPGVRVAVLDTAWPGHPGGTIDDDQLDWLDTVAAESDRPVVVLGHHHVWSPGEGAREAEYFGIQPEPSERLIDTVARRRSIVGYFCGHTHRNRVRRFAASGDVPFAEVACVKDFPGTWAEYRVFEGGILQVHHRISSPDALAWSESCRGIYGKFLDYGAYALGALEDRCFPFALR
jgi:3',5'-cyclic-AMP phosphodiesterase